MYKCLATILFIFFSNALLAQENRPVKNDRVLIVLNGDNSMYLSWSKDKSRFDAAGDIITGIIEEVYKVNPDVEFGLRVYGHQYQQNQGRCNDSRKEVVFSKDNLAQMALRLKDLKPKGSGSVEYAISQAIKQDFIDTNIYRYSIIVVTDSNKVCRDNICIPVNEYGKTNGWYKRYVLDLNGKEVVTNRYECFDRIFPVTNDYGIDTCTAKIVKDFKKRAAKQPKVVFEDKPQRRSFDMANSKVVIPAEKKPVIAKDTVVPKPSITITADTIVVKKPETVQIRKESKIKSEIDEFGFLKLINTGFVSRIIIYRIGKDDQQIQTNELYPVGMNEIRMKLKTGSYKMVFNISGISEGIRTFDIKNDMISEIMFR